MDKYPSFFVQRVLEYGKWSDWNILVNYYGKEKIVNICMNLRSLDPSAYPIFVLFQILKRRTIDVIVLHSRTQHTGTLKSVNARTRLL